MGKILITIGIILVIAGVIVHFFNRIPFAGKLPGDIMIDRPNFKFYFPITTSILLSILVSLIIFLFNKFKN
jgi:hypothetical protein